ncbi:Atrophin-1 multi-domain protein [Massilia violaceinigra]|uniref:Atrophin-1 multi-domain protein n=1 Tax=Massilia violaceinigra TaxID=2045208 RepID=A0ABY4A8L1_9BURK|nr:Atrophin-1 multi-domain protein [Massilia violaceinigra]UOD30495.1 Atrophin-1 multi-domain protein [Massilia violaceinigra]
MKRYIAVGTLALTVAALAQAQFDTKPAFGTYKKPFAADSLWNSYPVNPVLGTYQIPLTNKPEWDPTIDAGIFAAGVFEAKETDGPMLIYPYPNSKGVMDTDTEIPVPTYTIPHWPATTLPASGGDGHAVIADAKLNRLYSFSNLKKNSEGKWIATRVSWTPLNGSGWGTPSHHYQGGRAAGPAPAGGLIRKDEVNDGKATYDHALSMSLDFTGLSAEPNHYVYPATAADTTIAARPNTGEIPEGALVMLPPTFDTSKITDPKLLKVVRTLMKYGAYVVDRNEDTPFAIYVEIGAPWSAMPRDQLRLIRPALRRVVSHSGHIAGNGRPRVPETNVNLLSMRGVWTKIQGVGPLGFFDTFTQSLQWTAPTTNYDMIQRNFSNGGLGRVMYGAPKAGHRYKFSVESTGGVKMRMWIEVNKVVQKDTKLLANGQSDIIVWPDKGIAYYEALKPVGGAASAKVSLVELPPGQ